MTTEVTGIPVECPRCRNGLPGDARFCRRCGHAQGGDPFTRAARGVKRAGRRFATGTHGPVLGVDPVLWLFAALGGVATSVVRNFGDLASARTVGYAVGSTLVLLVCGAVVGRVAWFLSRKSNTLALLSGMAAIFFVVLGVIASVVNPPRAATAARSDRNWAETSTAGAAHTGLPVRLLPAAAVQQIPVSWRVSGRRVECIISNQSPWQLEELQVQAIVVANRRVVQTRSYPFTTRIAVGGTTTLELPIDLDPQARQSVHCQVVSARGVAPFPGGVSPNVK